MLAGKDWKDFQSCFNKKIQKIQPLFGWFHLCSDFAQFLTGPKTTYKNGHPTYGELFSALDFKRA
jgi:hypothetical protein